MAKARDQYVRKAVSFNSENPEQQALLDWAMKWCNGNFSAYVKKTLAAERQRQLTNLSDKQRKPTEGRANNQPNNKHHNQSAPLRGISVSIGKAQQDYTKG